ncbi:MAG: RNA 3'-terminal phosphate cyclase [Nanoarchaeota archaeon]|nr:RNA 3'-terminal phosphate cyclase [Nanoarchaeota archaeon]
MIEIDGSYGEGGGQIIRTALALSAITGKGFKAVKIRAGREKSGLKAQHLACITALKKICDAKTNSVAVGSDVLEFTPGKIKGGKFEIDIGTAGSITLLLQAVSWPCFFAPKKITLKIIGGTCGKWQAPVEYFQNVLLPHLNKLASKIDFKILKRGYYPKGGGIVELSVTPKKLDDVVSVDLVTRGDLVQIKGVSYASKDLEKAQVTERQARAAQKTLGKYEVPINISKEYGETLNPGTGIVLWAVFEGEDHLNPVRLGGSSFGERGKPSEKVGEEAAKNLIAEIDSDGIVDGHLADQLIPLLGLVGGQMKVVEVTKHVESNIYAVEKFLDVKFKIKDNLISVEKQRKSK